jgi:hypothetical protein
MKYTAGLLYDFVVNHITKKYLSENVISLEQKYVDILTEILTNSELSKELEIYQYMNHAHAKNDLDFCIMINEVKNKLKDIDYLKYVESQKKLLQVVEQSDMENYYNQQSKQQVINDSIVGWLSRKDNKIDDILNLERKLNDVLKKIENDKDKSSLKEHDEHFGRYIVDLMKKKYDQKYEQILNQEQKRLVQLFVEEKQEALKESLKDIKKRLQKVIFEKRKDMPYMINEKFDCILKDIDIENTVGIDEIKQHLLYIKLINNLYED